MAEFKQKIVVGLETTLVLNEAETGALGAIAGYGADAFLKVFYEHMGRHYLRPHEDGLRSLFQVVGMLDNTLEKARAARELIAKPLSPDQPHGKKA